jgi:hypothetical protein
MKLLFTTFLLWTSVAAAAPTPKDRFLPWVKKLHQLIGSQPSAAEAADAAIDQGGREPVFALQGLGKLYSADDAYDPLSKIAVCRQAPASDPFFTELRKAAKSIEDGIGQHDKWAAMGKEEKAQEARAELAKLIEKKGWVAAQEEDTVTWKLAEKLNAYAWLPPEEDRRRALTTLTCAMYNNVEVPEFDLTHLEEGRGLHELRREIRWFAIEARSLGGLVQFRTDDQDCPLPQYLKLLTAPIAHDHHSQLPVNPAEPAPCRISRCLSLAVSQFIKDLGDIKDEVEQLTGGETDDVPAELAERARILDQEFRESGVMPELRRQIGSCL